MRLRIPTEVWFLTISLIVGSGATHLIAAVQGWACSTSWVPVGRIIDLFGGVYAVGGCGIS